MLRKNFAIALMLWLAGFFIIGYGVWSFQAGHLMVLLYLGAGTLLYIIAAFTLRCGQCRLPILLRPRSIFGVEFFTWSLLPPKQCGRCGSPLTTGC